MIHKSIILILFVSSLMLFTGCSITRQRQTADIREGLRPITLRYWRVWDGEDDFQSIIDSYRALHPNIQIEYKKLRIEEYKQELLEAFAADRGPDIFSIHNTWTREYQAKGLIEPLPAQITMVFRKIVGSVKKELVYEARTIKAPTPAHIKRDYVDVVHDDVVISVRDANSNTQKEKIFGLPLSLDTLAMYYNKDLFNNAGISTPPEFWNREFQQDVKKLTKQNNKGEIIQSGVALGGSDNIERSSDILSALMMQNGTVMMEDGAVRFHQRPSAFADRNYNPGMDALRFYTDFANPAKEVYSWNQSQENSLDMFVQNKLAMMLGYSYMLPIIQSRAPKLNFTLTSLPQIEGNPQSINFANYWVESVSKKSEATEEAWDFILFMTNKNRIKTYLDKTNRPSALRSFIDTQRESETIGTFVEQTLTAKSWYRGVDAGAAEAIIKEMVDKVNAGQENLRDIINLGASKVQQTIKYDEIN